MTPNTTLLALAALLGAAGAAAAAPVTGQISIGGYAQGVSMGAASSMGTATGISFANANGTSVSGTSGVIASFGAGTGSFAALGACASATTGCGTIKDIADFSTQDPLVSFLTLSGAGASVGFDLSSITAVAHTTQEDGGDLTFVAIGTINFAGYDPTSGQFILTAQGNHIVSFSATTLAALAPEPASLAIVFGPIAAAGLLRRRARSAIAAS